MSWANSRLLHLEVDHAESVGLLVSRDSGELQDVNLPALIGVQPGKELIEHVVVYVE